MTSRERRAAAIRRLESGIFDVLVIGGGITGAGVARDAALRGLQTALLERTDFACGTSSRSSRLVHGGVRYLEHGHLHLVFESSRERRTLLRIAPHLIRPLAFTWPVYRGARISRARLSAGLALYDALSLFRNVHRHQRLSVGEVLEAEPLLRREGLSGGARYYDASTDDSRLTLANVLAAEMAGAVVLNHAPVARVYRDDHRAVAVEARDSILSSVFTVRARTIVNATGPWTDNVRELEESGPITPSILGSKGAHIAVPRARVGNRGAVVLLHPEDGRVLFILPAGAQTLIGTTETEASSGPDEVRATREDVRYLLAAGNVHYTEAGLGERDVIAAWAGIRPLAAGLVGSSSGSASREHAIRRGTHGILHVTGGKLTTYRIMAEQIVDQVVSAGRTGRAARCSTSRVPLPGGEQSPDEARAAAAGTVADAGVLERLVAAHGARWPAVWAPVARDSRLASRVSEDLPYAAAEFLHAARHEKAESLADLLIRRTMAAFQRSDHAMALAEPVADLVAPILGWDTGRRREEVRAYARDVERTFSIDGG